MDRAGWWSVTTEAVAQVMVDNSVTRPRSWSIGTISPGAVRGGDDFIV